MAVTVATYDNAEVWGPVVVVVAIVLANLLAWALNERSWPFRHLLSRVGLPKLLFISNRADKVNKSSRPKTYWAFDLLDPHHLVQSPVLNTAGLLVLHACTFLYWVATVLVDVVVEWYGYGCTASWCYRRSGTYLEWMTFLTNWSISILGLSGLVAFINTARFARQQRNWHKQQQHSREDQQQQLHMQQKQASEKPGSQEGVRFHSPAGDGITNVGTAPAAAAVPASTGVAAHSRSVGRGVSDVVSATQQQQQRPGRDQGALHAPFQHQQQHPNKVNIVPQQEPSSVSAGGASNSGSSDSSSSSSGSASSSCCSSSCDTVVVVQGDGSQPGAKQPVAQWDWLSRTHCLLSEVATTAAFFVSFWFWVGLVAIAGEMFRANGGTLMAHAGNLVIAALQLLLTRLPVVSTHFQVLLWYATLYEVFLWAYGGGSGVWRYGLDWQKAKPAGALILVPVVIFIFFCLWYLVACLREAFLRRLQRLRDQRRHRRNPQHSAATDAVV